MNTSQPPEGSDVGPAESPLDPPPHRLRDMGAAAVEWAAAYLGSVRDLPIAPVAGSAELRSRLAEPLPAEGRDFDSLLATFRDVVVAGTRHHGHPRFFGYVSSPGTAVAAVADFLASALNANLPAWRSAPAPTELERLTIDWIKQALGCDPGAGGLFTSGGSMANLTALAAARHRHCGDAVSLHGVASRPAPLRVYTSTQAHHSTHKAAALLGIGRENVRSVATDRSTTASPRRTPSRSTRTSGSTSRPTAVACCTGTRPRCRARSRWTPTTPGYSRTSRPRRTPSGTTGPS